MNDLRSPETITSSKSLLAVFAHPDDESFAAGGTMARYTAEGCSAVLVCATRGEVGAISDSSLAEPGSLAEVRESELRCAGKALGVSEIIFYGYRNSGMPGTEDNDHPRACANAPDKDVVARISQTIRHFRPQVIVTFDPSGGYGHPDHIAIHRHTLAAFHSAADPAQYAEQGPAWQPARLFYAVFPGSFLWDLRRRLLAAGADASELYILERSSGIGWPDNQVHASIDVSSTIEAKWAALN